MKRQSQHSRENVRSNTHNPTWTLRVASEEDLEPALLQLTDHMNEQQREAFRVKLQRYVRKPDRELILAVSESRILGLVCVIMQTDLPLNFTYERAHHLRDFAFGTQLFVHPEHRNRGIGSSLHHQSLQWARERGRAGHWLITHRMAAWYRRKFGYEEFGRIKRKGVKKILMAKAFKQSYK